MDEERGLSIVVDRKLHLTVFGAFRCSIGDAGQPLPVKGKTAALLALLADATNARRTRTWLKDMLWPRSEDPHGRNSLRQCLTQLRKLLGPVHARYFGADNTEVWLYPEHIVLLGNPRNGVYLEGLELHGAEGFERWLREKRQLIAAGVHGVDPDGERPTGSGLITTSSPRYADRLRPSIAVLPFMSISENGSDTMFGEVIAGDLSRLLARAHGIDVISHLSCRSPGFVDADLGQLRERFHLDFLVTGLLRPSGNSFSIDLEFVEVATGHVINVERFTASRHDLMTGDAGVMRDIAVFVVESLFKGSVGSLSSRPLAEIESHRLLMAAIALMHRQDLAGVSRSYKLLNLVCKRSPRSAQAFAWLGQWYVLFIAQGWSTNLAEDAAKATQMVETALTIDPDCSFSRVIQGLVAYQLRREFETGREHFDNVLASDQNNALAWLWKGTLLAFEGQGEKAVAFTDRASFLAPLDPGGYLYLTLSATAHLANKDYETALIQVDKALDRNSHHASTLRAKIACLYGLDRIEEGRDTTAQLLKLDPTFTVSRYLDKHPAADFWTGQEWAEALRACGIPER